MNISDAKQIRLVDFLCKLGFSPVKLSLIHIYMAKKTTTQKEPVKLREKKLANGNVSLYLDIYRNGKRHKEYFCLLYTSLPN